jgi:hypothetical protein
VTLFGLVFIVSFIVGAVLLTYLATGVDNT